MQHAGHRTQRVRIRGLMLHPPGGDGPVEVCVNHHADWELIYKNPEIRVKCVVESCQTLLTAKRMSRSGLRFLAVRSGGCSHNLVEMPVERGETEQDPSNLVGGGGPEGDEHLWMKGRLFKIAQALGVEAVVEHAPTCADVFLPEHHLVLEYQRWDTDFLQRTAQRSTAGATRTVWLFPWQPPNTTRTRRLKTFNNAVFEHGGIYVAVWKKDGGREPQRPWEDASQERTARLYASGSIAEFDPDLGALIRKPRSLATVLAQIISGDRVLAESVIRTKSSGREARARVWVLRDDLAQSEAVQTEGRRDTTRTTGKASAPKPKPDPTTLPESRQEGEPVAGAKISQDDGPDLATPRDDLGPTPEAAPHETIPANSEVPMARLSQDRTPEPSRSRWKSIVDWFRRM